MSQGNKINTFFHCRKCLQEMPKGESPMTWARLEIGLTFHGVQVWCNRHACNVVHLKIDELKTIGDDDA